MLIVGAGLFWLLCWVLTVGIDFAFFQREWPRLAAKSRRQDAGMACLLGVFGPLALIIAYCFSGFAEHGFLLPWSHPLPPGRDEP